jgi:N-acetylglucosamine transport system permease protein
VGALDVLRHAVLCVASLVALGPVVWIVTLALRSQREFLSEPFALPSRLYLGNFGAVLTNERMAGFFYNSVVTTAGAVVVVAAASTLAAYALARIPFRGSRVLLMLYLIGETIPVFVVLIPLFILVQLLHLAGSRWSLIFTYAAMNMGISVFFMRGFFRTIPREMEDAARIEGCGVLPLIAHVMLPLVRPGLLVVIIFNFIGFWNEYFLASILLPSQDLFTLPAGLAASFSTVYATNWPAMAAGIILSVLPSLAMFVFAQDKIIEGWTVTGK